jgi:hypothetical protein
MVNFSFLNLFLDTWIRNPDPDSEYGSGSRPKLNMDPTGSGYETLEKIEIVLNGIVQRDLTSVADPNPRGSELF